MEGLAGIVWNLITETSGAPDAVWPAIRQHVRTDPLILLDAWDELADLGTDAAPHTEQAVQARQLVAEVLHAIGDAAGARGRNLDAVAAGLVALVAREIAAYRQERKVTGRPRRRPTSPRAAHRGRRPGRGR